MMDESTAARKQPAHAKQRGTHQAVVGGKRRRTAQAPGTLVRERTSSRRELGLTVGRITVACTAHRLHLRVAPPPGDHQADH